MQTNQNRQINFKDIKVSDNPVENLRFKIRYNLVDDQPKAKRQLQRLLKNAV